MRSTVSAYVRLAYVRLVVIPFHRQKAAMCADRITAGCGMDSGNADDVKFRDSNAVFSITYEASVHTGHVTTAPCTRLSFFSCSFGVIMMQFLSNSSSHAAGSPTRGLHVKEQVGGVG